MKRIIYAIVAIVMLLAAIIGLNPKASEMEIWMSMAVFFILASYVTHQMDKAERGDTN